MLCFRVLCLGFRSVAHMMWGLFWESPGKTGAQTAAFQTASSSRRGLSSGRPLLPAPTAAGSWTASLCGQQSSTPVRKRRRAQVRTGERETETPDRATCARGMRHLRDLFTAFVGSKPGRSSYNPSASLWVIPDMEWIRYWNKSLKFTACAAAMKDAMFDV